MGDSASKNAPDFKRHDSFAEMYCHEALGCKQEYEIKEVEMYAY